MPIIFLSYRREDSRGDTGRLYDRLAEHFGKKRIFRDVEAIAPGERFPEVLDRTLKKCDVFLAVIGPKWLSLRKGKKRRLENPDDPVRWEIATALNRGIPIVPVLVDKKTRMPEAHNLPPELAPFASYQAAALQDLHFHDDVDLLIKRIEAVAGSKTTPRLIPRNIDPTRPWSYRDPDWFSETSGTFYPPLCIEWPPEIVPQVHSNNALTSEIESLCDELLQHFWKNWGVILPGICMSQSNVGGQYTARIFGLPVHKGKISKSKRKADSANVLVQPIRELGQAVRDKLPYLVGHQEVANLIAVQAGDAREEINQTSGALSDLVLVCRALLAEQVSLAPFAAIVASFLSQRSTRQPLVQIVEEIRSLEEVRPLLPGNDETHSFVQLSTALERDIVRSLNYNSSQPVLAMDPAKIQSLWASLQTAFQDLEGNVALLVNSNTIRPFVRKLVSSQYAYLGVLSQKELLPGLSKSVIATVN